MARDVAVALDYAHGRNVVHRDIKPENILLTAGTAVVADFGIAKMLNAGGSGFSLTRAGLTVGTVAYMSPEQASAGEVDGRSDIYALGCVLYEMLTGNMPFTGTTTRAMVAAHFTAPVPSLRAVLLTWRRRWTRCWRRRWRRTRTIASRPRRSSSMHCSRRARRRHASGSSSGWGWTKRAQSSRRVKRPIRCSAHASPSRRPRRPSRPLWPNRRWRAEGAPRACASSRSSHRRWRWQRSSGCSGAHGSRRGGGPPSAASDGAMRSDHLDRCADAA
ncbi:MAG: serine/threonine protein kinase [Gemmatimonadetes bacterium]|nr:serine/threonine protein kinase [Gemmatimonadota bacterium]